MCKAIPYAIDKPNVTIVRKGGIMKFTVGGFRDWANAPALGEFGTQCSKSCCAQPNTARSPR